jgi:hypothetical protein
MNVGQLKAALADLPDDRPILSQVAANDGTAWNMPFEFIGQVPFGTVAAVILRHPDLDTMPALSKHKGAE